MHPVSYLFDDIYRNYWGISPASRGPERPRLTKIGPRSRQVLAHPQRGQD